MTTLTLLRRGRQFHARNLKPPRASWLLFPLLAALAGCAGGPGAKPTVTTSPTGTASAVKAPSVIYVTDFYLPPGLIQQSQTLPEKVGLGGGPVSRIREDVRALRGDDPESKAKKLVKTLGETITSSLNKAGHHAEYRPNASGLRADFFPSAANLPKEGWLLGGWFERVQEGNRVAEAAIGFGAGSGQVAIEVAVSDLAGDPRQPFLFLGSENAHQRMPGGLVALNPYAIAAKFVLTRGETERDVKAMGAAIARSVAQQIEAGSGTKPKP
jgi:hypothetical protein